MLYLTGWPMSIALFVLVGTFTSAQAFSSVGLTSTKHRRLPCSSRDKEYDVDRHGAPERAYEQAANLRREITNLERDLASLRMRGASSVKLLYFRLVRFGRSGSCVSCLTRQHGLQLLMRIASKTIFFYFAVLSSAQVGSGEPPAAGTRNPKYVALVSMTIRENHHRRVWGPLVLLYGRIDVRIDEYTGVFFTYSNSTRARLVGRYFVDKHKYITTRITSEGTFLLR